MENVALLSISQEVFMKVVGPLKDLVVKAQDLRELVKTYFDDTSEPTKNVNIDVMKVSKSH